MSQLKVDTITDEEGTGSPDFPNGITVNNGTIDNTVIGGSTPAAISGTTGSFASITGTAVTQSDTDTTAGRLLKTGDFKIGEEGSTDTVQPLGSVARHNMTTSLIYKGRLTSGDLNNIYEPGIYRINSGADASDIANTPAQTSGAVLEVISPDGVRAQGSRALAVQRYTQRTQANRVRVWQRGSLSISEDSWQDWSEIFTQANILGTVSQSAGVPTGAIIQRGSNANGEFVRFADGTQIAWHTYSGVDVDSATGEGFRSDAIGYTLPVSFVGIVFHAGQLDTTIRWVVPGAAGFRGYGFISGTGHQARIVSTGRWF